MIQTIKVLILQNINKFFLKNDQEKLINESNFVQRTLLQN